MNSLRVRQEIGILLDHELNHDIVLRTREPKLPLPTEDRTDWLLWCTEKHYCTMDEANRMYWFARAQALLRMK